jgi:hypothetical protein
MKALMGLLMNNGKIKMVKNTQTNVDNAEMVKTAFNLVGSAIIKRL